MSSDFASADAGPSNGWEQVTEPQPPPAIAVSSPPPAPVPLFKPILRGKISPCPEDGPRKYVWDGPWAMSVDDPLTSGFRYAFDLPMQYMGPPLAPGAVPANPLLPSNISHQVCVREYRRWHPILLSRALVGSAAAGDPNERILLK